MFSNITKLHSSVIFLQHLIKNIYGNLDNEGEDKDNYIHLTVGLWTMSKWWWCRRTYLQRENSGNGQKSTKTGLNNEQMVKTRWMLAGTEAKRPEKRLCSLGQFLHRQINGSTYAFSFHTPFKVLFFPEISLCGILGGLMNPVAMTTLFLAFSWAMKLNLVFFSSPFFPLLTISTSMQQDKLWGLRWFPAETIFYFCLH